MKMMVMRMILLIDQPDRQTDRQTDSSSVVVVVLVLLLLLLLLLVVLVAETMMSIYEYKSHRGIPVAETLFNHSFLIYQYYLLLLSVFIYPVVFFSHHFYTIC